MSYFLAKARWQSWHENNLGRLGLCVCICSIMLCLRFDLRNRVRMRYDGRWDGILPVITNRTSVFLFMKRCFFSFRRLLFLRMTFDRWVHKVRLIHKVGYIQMTIHRRINPMLWYWLRPQLGVFFDGHGRGLQLWCGQQVSRSRGIIELRSGQ